MKGSLGLRVFKRGDEFQEFRIFVQILIPPESIHDGSVAAATRETPAFSGDSGCKNAGHQCGRRATGAVGTVFPVFSQVRSAESMFSALTPGVRGPDTGVGGLSGSFCILRSWSSSKRRWARKYWRS